MDDGTTKTDVVNYLKKHLPQWAIENSLKTRSEIFEDMSATEFAGKTNWDEVLGIFKRMYG